MGGGWVKNCLKLRDVIYGRPLKREVLPFSIQGDLSQSMKETPRIPKINNAEAKMFQ